MEKKEGKGKLLRQRKFFTVVPILVLPFITLAFWALGGGEARAVDSREMQGLNLNLPGANNKDETSLDKLSYYSQAERDSAKVRELEKNDPYFSPDPDERLINPDEERLGFDSGSLLDRRSGQASSDQGMTYNDPNEQRVNRKLAEINKALTQPADQRLQNGGSSGYSGPQSAGNNSESVDRLERMMLAMQQGKEADPEMTQLNGMLENIMDIQTPERVKEKLQQASEQRRGKIFAVTTKKKVKQITSLDDLVSGQGYGANNVYQEQRSKFYNLDGLEVNADSQNAVEAIIPETQTIVTGATVKLLLLDDIYINGVLVPKDNNIFGTAALSGERLIIKIIGIRYKNNSFPVELSVIDLDGMDGLNIPGAITRDVAKQSVDRGIQDIGFSSLDPSIGMQAASVGVEAAKSLLSKKVKLIKVTVKAGYHVLLRDEKQKQNN